MISRIPLFIAVAILQIVVIATIVLMSGPEDNKQALQFSLDEGAVSRLVIADGNDEVVTLTHLDEGWVLPDTQGFAAQESQVVELLNKIAKINATWPVASSETTAERFEVTDAKFQRHVSIYSGDSLVSDFYLGTSPGYRKQHLRVAGSSQIYAVNLAQHEFNTGSEYWMDKSLLAIEDEIDSIQLADNWSLELTDETWMMTSLSEQRAPEAIDQEKAKALARLFTTFRIAGFADPDVVGSVADQTPDMSYSVAYPVPAPDNAVEVQTEPRVEEQLDFFHREDPDDYVVRSSRFPGLFRVNTYVAEPFKLDALHFEAEETDSAAELTDVQDLGT